MHKLVVTACITTFLTLVSCGSPKLNSEQTDGDIQFSDGDGSSIEEAIKITGASSHFSGIAAEYAWLKDKYGHFELRRRALIQNGDRYYDMMIVDIDGKERTIYFDINDFWGRQ